MNDSTIAFRAKEQLGKFLGKVFTHFSRPRQKFLADMLYGIQASGDTQLSSVMRAINDDSGKCHAVEKRLSRNVADATIGDDIDKAILEAGAKFVRDDTLILVDPTEIRKEFGLKMEHVTMIRDASRSSKEGRDVLVHGYHGCMAVACQNGKRKTVPLALRLWSSNAPGHKGENDEVLKIITGIMAATGGKGVLVYDRGGDRPAFYGAFIDNSRDFIVRMAGRSVLAWKGMHEIHWLASQCVMRHKHHVEFDSHGKECNIQIEFGAMPVRLPWRDEELRLVVVKGFGRKPMMLLTNLAVNEKAQAEGKDGTDYSYKSLWQVVEGYLTRWRIEETIRFVKQCYGFEHIRVMSYASWRNMSAIVLATTYFTAAWLGRGVRKDVLVAHIEHMHQRFNEVPEFFLYALAAGIKRAFVRYGNWETKAVVKKKDDRQPTLPGWDELSYLGVG